MYLIGGAQLRVTDILIKETGFLGYGEEIDSDRVYQSVSLENGEDGNIDKLTGRLAIIVPYETGDMFALQYSARNRVVGSSEDQSSPAPVPEPATILLLGSGLAGLAFYRRKRK